MQHDRSNRWVGKTLAIGFALALVAVAAIKIGGRHRDEWRAAATPALLPDDPAVARLHPNNDGGIAQTALVEAVDGRLEFGPPPLGAAPAATKSAPVTVAPPAKPPVATPVQAPVIVVPPVATPPVVVPPVAKPVQAPTVVVPPLPRPAAVAPQSQPLPQTSPQPAPTVRRLPVVGGEAPGVRSQVSEVRNQGSGVRDQQLVARDQGTDDRSQPLPAPPQPRIARRNAVLAPGEPPGVAMAAAVARPAVMPRPMDWQRQMQPVAMQADEKIREAFETCGRGALFAGRSELIQALRLIARNADAVRGGSAHSDALAAGLRAMTEAESFVPRGSRLESELDVIGLVASHRTPVVREALAGAEAGRRITSLEAQNRYYTYAQQQLAASAAGLPIGAVALYGLGKIHGALAAADSDNRTVEEPKAITMYQAALLVDSGNPLAAHELGVLLARYQRYDEAVAMFQHSAQIAALPETWQNLALVHERRGEMDLARRARQEADSARTRLSAAKPASHPALARGSVRWMSAEEFAQTRPADSNHRSVREAKSPPPPAAAPTNTGKPSGIWSWLPWTSKG